MNAMTEPHICRLSLFSYAALAVSRIIYFGDCEAHAERMPGLIEAGDLPTLVVFVLRDIKSADEATRELKTDATIRSIEALRERIHALIENSALRVYDPHIFLHVEPSQILEDWHKYLVRLDDVSAWLKTQGIDVAYALNSVKSASDSDSESDEAENAHGDTGKERTRDKWPWGKHHTELLGHLEAAARRYWGENYLPSDATTAPINATVSEWLQSERKVSRTMADSIASILRPDGLPTGPRK